MPYTGSYRCIDYYRRRNSCITTKDHRYGMDHGYSYLRRLLGSKCVWLSPLFITLRGLSLRVFAASMTKQKASNFLERKFPQWLSIIENPVGVDL